MTQASAALETLDDVLGIESGIGTHGDLAFITLLKDGLPQHSLSSVAQRIAPDDKTFRFRLVPRATLARNKGHATLSPEHSAKVARLAKVWSAALAVWKEADAARDFLRRPHPLLDNMTPLDVTLQSEFGGPLVERLLGRLEYGAAV